MDTREAIRLVACSRETWLACCMLGTSPCMLGWVESSPRCWIEGGAVVPAGREGVMAPETDEAAVCWCCWEADSWVGAYCMLCMLLMSPCMLAEASPWWMLWPVGREGVAWVTLGAGVSLREAPGGGGRLETAGVVAKEGGGDTDPGA